jgi:hypothetical protein
MSAALFAPATMIRSSFEQRASSIIGSMMRRVGVRRDWSMAAPSSREPLAAEPEKCLGGACETAISVGWRVTGTRLATHVELEDARNHDHGLWLIPVFEHCEFHRFGAVDE